jgi:Rubrerythrin.
MAKAFSELSEREILALAISLEEDDARIYGDYADRLKADYPDTAKMLEIMRDEELVHAQKLMDTCRAQLESTFLFSKAGRQGVPSPETRLARQSAERSAGAKGG